MTVQDRVAQMGRIAAQAKREVPTNDTALVGPCRTYDDDRWKIMIVTGRQGVERGWIISVALSAEYEEEPDPNSPLYQAADNVMWLRGADTLTPREADQVRAGLVEAMREHFEVVEEFDTDIGLVTENHARFPCQESAELFRELTRNPTAGDQRVLASRGES
jgi:hypothetical protein